MFGVDLASVNAPHHKLFLEILDDIRKGRGIKAATWRDS